MIAAQEMFRYANRVTRAEKALILGFMAGARGICLTNFLFLIFLYNLKELLSRNKF